MLKNIDVQKNLRHSIDISQQNNTMSARRPACEAYQGRAMCENDEHCTYVQPGGPCRSRSQLKRYGIAEGLRERKRRAAGTVPMKSAKRVAASKAAAKKNPWLRHVRAVRAANPKMAYKDVLRLASQSYTKVGRR